MVKSDIKSLGTSTAGKSRSPAHSEATSAGSSRHAAREKTNDENFTIVSRDAPRRRQTDWAAVETLTDEQIEAAIRNDPDAVPLDFDWSEAVLVMPPKKQAISIRVDQDVLDFFKAQGAGYQRRINAVLRAFMEQTAGPKRKSRTK